ncbi:MAG: hypothetical protein KF900_09915 [Bacteroidetes bacterium]|nr:hypothetical protein [Bacteroidota bacterium]
MQYTQKQLATSAQGAFRAALAILLTFGGLFARAEKDMLPTTQLPSQQFFIENKGQWHADVLYLVRTGGLDAWITKAGVTYDFYATERKHRAKSNEIN